MQARQAGQAVRKVKLLVAVSNVGVPDELDTDQTKKSNEWIPLLLFTMLIAALEPNSKVREFMADSYPEALRVLDESRSELFFPHDVALYHENDLALAAAYAGTGGPRGVRRCLVYGNAGHAERGGRQAARGCRADNRRASVRLGRGSAETR